MLGGAGQGAADVAGEGDRGLEEGRTGEGFAEKKRPDVHPRKKVMNV
jgi:hypothetical protein